MPYPRPTLTTLQQQTIQDIIAARIADGSGNVVTALLRKAVLRVLAWVVAGLAYQHYGYLDWIAKQATPWTATGEFAVGWGALVGITTKDATAAVLSIDVAGATPGTTIPASTPVSRPGDDFGYLTTAATSVAADGTATLPVLATLPGSAGNCDDGTSMVLTNGIAGVPSGGLAVSDTLAVAVDQETEDAFKSRYLIRYRAPPQGGDHADYVEWCLAVPGVTRAWVKGGLAGPGTVSVFTMWDIAEAATGGFPVGTNGVAATEVRDTAAAGDQLTVANALQPLQQVTALVYSVAPLQQPVAFTVSGLGTANTAANQAAITGALADMFLRLGQVGATLDPATMAPWPPIDPSSWYAAIASVLGTQQFLVTAPPAVAIVSLPSALPVLGVVTFQT